MALWKLHHEWTLEARAGNVVIEIDRPVGIRGFRGECLEECSATSHRRVCNSFAKLENGAELVYWRVFRGGESPLSSSPSFMARTMRCIYFSKCYKV